MPNAAKSAHKFARRFGRNAVLRVTALMLAIALWAFVNTGQRNEAVQLNVPVKYDRLPIGMVILNQHPDFIQLDISGPGTLLSLLDPGRLRLKLDLAGVTPGQADFKIDPQMFSLPRQTVVERISPSSISLDVDRIVTRDIPVHVNVSGAPARGYVVSEVETAPLAVSVTGPNRIVSRLDKIDTQWFDIGGANKEVQRVVALAAPGGMVTLSVSEVEARATIQEIVADRQFRSITVEVRDAGYRFLVKPRQVNVTVRGPASRVSKLTLEGSVYVDAMGAEPGTHLLPVQVELPNGIELVRQSPEKVRLRMFGERIGARG